MLLSRGLPKDMLYMEALEALIVCDTSLFRPEVSITRVLSIFMTIPTKILDTMRVTRYTKRSKVSLLLCAAGKPLGSSVIIGATPKRGFPHIIITNV